MLLQASSTRNAQISHGVNHKELTWGHFSASGTEFPAGTVPTSSDLSEAEIWRRAGGEIWEQEH